MAIPHRHQNRRTPPQNQTLGSIRGRGYARQSFETNGRKINCTVGEYLKQTIERLETLGKYGSASKHRSLLSRLSEFRSLNTRFDEIDLAFLRDFELFLRKEGNVNNSIATQYAILQCLCIRCHGGLCPLFRTHQNQRKSSLTIWSGCFWTSTSSY
ncbi:MAG: phage integrase SAM-like domain-containing protein [Alistipes shahii]